jgi:F-type H+-transporting ATPase subunit b
MTRGLRQYSIALAVSLLPSTVLAADDHGGGALVPPTVWAIISFLIVLFIIWKKLIPLINSAMDKRAAAIRESLEAAERARAEAQEMMRQHQADLETARHEARAIIEEGKRDAEAVKHKIVDSARHEAEAISARTRREIDLAKKAALEDLHHRSVALSIDLAERLVERSLDPADHQRLIQERIRRFAES